MSDLKLGDLVNSQNEEFSGTGKIVEFSDAGTAVVAFFHSPLEPETAKIACSIQQLSKTMLFDEQVIFLEDENTNYWRRARYGGSRPDELHLAIFRAGEQRVVQIEDIYVPYVPSNSFLDPFAFLEARATDTPLFTEWRLPFIKSYIEQRAAARSMSSIPSSSIELEAHQLAVVRRVLQDHKKKYLLGDEVGLGKTVEAGLILREMMLQQSDVPMAVVGAPAALLNQWHEELRNRFHLSDLFDHYLFIVEHEKLPLVLSELKPSIVIIDEAHQISSWTWNPDLSQRYKALAHRCHEATVCLLLSGTPLIGNELNFLSMLYLLAPENYALTDVGIEEFKSKIDARERIGGIYQALTAENDNVTLGSLLEQLLAMFGDDEDLQGLVESAIPLTDIFASEANSERTKAIMDLREYIGEHYRLHQRMLRNRRDDDSVRYLFPGLSGVTFHDLTLEGEQFTVEQYLEMARPSERVHGDDSFYLPEKNFESWIKTAISGPLMVSIRARNHLIEHGSTMGLYEKDFFQDLASLGDREQKQKDRFLGKILREIWDEHPDAGIVVFCTDVSLVESVFSALSPLFKEQLERFTPGETPNFCFMSRGKALIADIDAEDGLNLHGGKKIVIHYSLPASLPRIEQRLGRVNRYSAAIKALPIESKVIVTKGSIYTAEWVRVLADDIKIFEESIASLQYVLEDRINEAWDNIVKHGVGVFSKLSSLLTGETGVIQSERQRVRAQEELNRMDVEVRQAAEFAEQILDADEKAEEHCDMMLNWIIKGLRFNKLKGEVVNTFRFKYSTGINNAGRTLLDVKSFIEQCVTGIDQEASDYTSPVTSLMSPHRSVSGLGSSVYPLRYGQPFIDVIYKSLSIDPRGLASAKIRFVQGLNLTAPKSFLGLHFLISNGSDEQSLEDQRRYDEVKPPRVEGVWVGHDGKVVQNNLILEILNKPYNKKPGGRYRDKNIGSEVWDEIENYLPEDQWPRLLEIMISGGQASIRSTLENKTENPEKITPISAEFILLAGMG